MKFDIGCGVNFLQFLQIFQAFARLLRRKQQLGSLQVGVPEFLVEVDADVEVVQGLFLVLQSSQLSQQYS